MKKRLGTVPKGLEWISEIHEPEVSQEKLVEQKTKTPEHLIPAAKRGLPEELIRATFILRQDYLEKIKAHAYWERIQIKEVFDQMCEQFFEGKKVRSIPQKRK
ncbi:MAG: hypothetical protein CL947_00495 [Epsilonproteobacteria bacterium]|nr:hypothetical protein [Campylobacterota bacterium]